MQNNTPSTLKFEKKSPNTVYQPEQILIKGEILGLGLTQYHYFILQKNMITIMSRISQKIIHFYDLSDMADVKGMLFDVSEDCYWVYGSK